MRQLVIYFLCPVEGGRIRFVRTAPTGQEIEHYLGIAERIAAGARFRAVGLYGFAKELVDAGRVEPRSDWIVNPGGVRTVRVEESPAARQGELMEEVA